MSLDIPQRVLDSRMTLLDLIFKKKESEVIRDLDSDYLCLNFYVSSQPKFRLNNLNSFGNLAFNTTKQGEILLRSIKNNILTGYDVSFIHEEDLDPLNYWTMEALAHDLASTLTQKNSIPTYLHSTKQGLQSAHITKYFIEDGSLTALRGDLD